MISITRICRENLLCDMAGFGSNSVSRLAAYVSLLLFQYHSQVSSDDADVSDKI